MHDAYNATQMLNMLQDLPWVKIDERYYLDNKSANPIGLASGLKETVIDGKWYYSVDTVMEQMRNNPNRYGSLFRSKVIAEIGGGIRFHYPKNAHELTILLSKLDGFAYKLAKHVAFMGNSHFCLLNGLMRSNHSKYERNKTCLTS